MLNATSILGILPIIDIYWKRFSKTSSFVSGNQIDYLPKPKAGLLLATDKCDNSLTTQESDIPVSRTA